MTTLFLTVLNMSFTASFVIAAVILARLVLHWAPRKLSYALWGVAGFRLLIPFAWESILGLLPVRAKPIPVDIDMQAVPKIDSGLEALDSAINRLLPAMAAPPVQGAAESLGSWLELGAWAWLLGVAVMLLYSVLSLLRLRYSLRGAICTEEHVYECASLRTPFVIGLFQPRIYLPAGLSEDERRYILLHEQTHIQRRDPMVKLLGYLALSIHWFNPLVWLGFVLMGTDMEMSCDERVLRTLGPEIKGDYSLSLVRVAAGRRILNGAPLAFGEGGMKGRVKNVLKNKKASGWLVATGAILVVILSLGFVSSRAQVMPLERPFSAEDLMKRSGQSHRYVLQQLGQPDGYESGRWSDIYLLGDGRCVRLDYREDGSVGSIFMTEFQGFAEPDSRGIITLCEARLTPDGSKQTIEMDTTTYESLGTYTLRVVAEDGRILWQDDAGYPSRTEHPLSLVQLDGQDYLVEREWVTLREGRATRTFSCVKRAFYLSAEGTEFPAQAELSAFDELDRHNLSVLLRNVHPGELPDRQLSLRDWLYNLEQRMTVTSQTEALPEPTIPVIPAEPAA